MGPSVAQVEGELSFVLLNYININLEIYIIKLRFFFVKLLIGY